MNSNHAEAVSAQQLATTFCPQSQQNRRRSHLSHGSTPSFSAQALVQLARTSPHLAALATVCGAILVIAAGMGSIHVSADLIRRVEMHADVAPLAPAPHPPLPPALALRPTPAPLLHRLHVNPLAGLASWYGDVWNGRKTASGEEYDESLLTAAHKSLPLGTVVRVTNLQSMRSVIVRINDRGAFSPSRVIDLSSAAAREIGMMSQGLARVRLEILGKN